MIVESEVVNSSFYVEYRSIDTYYAKMLNMKVVASHPVLQCIFSAAPKLENAEPKNQMI